MGKVDVNFYKVWTGVSSSAKVIISDIKSIIYVKAVVVLVSAVPCCCLRSNLHLPQQQGRKDPRKILNFLFYFAEDI